jgi:hypothetical protein
MDVKQQGGMFRDEEGAAHTTPSNLVANRINIKKNTPYSFIDRPFMMQIFDDEYHQIGLMTARQVSKSTTLAADSIINCEAHAPFTSLIVTPSQDQTRKFSHDRLGPTIESSPAVRAQVTAEELSSVLEKEFISGSKIYMSYAKDNPDRARGITADEIKLDEVQDMILKLVEPVLRESMFTSPFQRVWWSGTPKSMSNGIEQRIWRQSDQREWMVRCWHCTNAAGLPYHQKMTWANVKGGTGPVCKKCERLINTLDGQWVITSTRTEQGKEPKIHGYHIPQILFPTRTHELAPGKFGFLNWDQFLEDISNPETDEATILNEKFGESSDNDDRPIKEDELMAICDPAITQMATLHQKWMLGTQTFAGIDWGHGKSATVLVIGQFDPGNTNQFRYLFMRKYVGRDADPKICVPQMLRLMQQFRVHRVHADYGAGFGLNSQIADALGEEFITKNYWSSSIKGKKVKYNEDMDAYIMNRSLHITRFFQAIKRMQMKCHFRWEDFREFARDIMHVFREERKNGDMYYDHKPEEPDDAMHAMIYCWLIASFFKYNHEGIERIKGTEHDVMRA